MSWQQWLITVAVVIVAVAIIWVSILSVTRATRLHRLNVRVDLARTSLIAALDRRAVVARAIGATCDDEELAAELVAAADGAEESGLADREVAENRLSMALSRTDPAARPPGLTAELADAAARVSIGRRFYNDAVRDARTLGQRALVRWLHLGGHSVLPEYFEISEPVSGD